MKKLNIYSIVVLTISIIVGTTSCSGFLEEENRESATDATFLNDKGALDALVANLYNKMRIVTTSYDAARNIPPYDVDELGTDIVTRGAQLSGIDEINDYVNMSPMNPSFLYAWQDHYNLIAAANIITTRIDQIPDLTAEAKAIALGQAKFFRAYGYFHLVEQFGGVPLLTQEIRTVTTNFTRNTEQEVYSQIIADLNESLEEVEEKPAQYGRVSKNAVRHLQSLVLLTRGYKSFAATTDFADAAALAETVIANHPLEPKFAFTNLATQRNKEVVFALLYGTNAVSIGSGNNRHRKFKFNYYSYPGMKASSNTYQKGLNPALTPFYFSLFEDGDVRADSTFRRAIKAEEKKGTLNVGDTAIFFPKTAWTADAIQKVKYVVINPGTYFNPNAFTTVHFPMFKKFDNPGVAYSADERPAMGTRDAIIFRSGEARLIAAEAYLGAGNSTKAAEHLTALRTRAKALSPLPTITVDFILDERARELTGEVSRWMDLKRTGKLIERVLAHNPHAKLNNAITTKHLLRPIPQNEIDQSQGSIKQNDDY